MILGRVKDEWPDYLIFRAEIAVSEDDKAILADFTEDERVSALLSLKLELARAGVGYSGLTAIDSGLNIFTKIPINHALSEDQLIESIWKLEAVVNQVYLIGAIAAQRHKASQKDVGVDHPTAETEQLLRV